MGHFGITKLQMLVCLHPIYPYFARNSQCSFNSRSSVDYKTAASESDQPTSEVATAGSGSGGNSDHQVTDEHKNICHSAQEKKTSIESLHLIDSSAKQASVTSNSVKSFNI